MFIVHVIYTKWIYKIHKNYTILNSISNFHKHLEKLFSNGIHNIKLKLPLISEYFYLRFRYHIKRKIFYFAFYLAIACSLLYVNITIEFILLKCFFLFLCNIVFTQHILQFFLVLGKHIKKD